MKSLFQTVPMLVGVSDKGGNKNSLIIEVSKDHVTDFAAVSVPVMISGDDFLFHSDEYEDAQTSVFKRRHIWPGFPKQHITEEEKCRVKNFISEMKNTALNCKGLNSR